MGQIKIIYCLIEFNLKHAVSLLDISHKNEEPETSHKEKSDEPKLGNL